MTKNPWLLRDHRPSTPSVLLTESVIQMDIEVNEVAWSRPNVGTDRGRGSTSSRAKPASTIYSCRTGVDHFPIPALPVLSDYKYHFVGLSEGRCNRKRIFRLLGLSIQFLTFLVKSGSWYICLLPSFLTSRKWNQAQKLIRKPVSYEIFSGQWSLTCFLFLLLHVLILPLLLILSALDFFRMKILHKNRRKSLFVLWSVVWS